MRVFVVVLLLLVVAAGAWLSRERWLPAARDTLESVAVGTGGGDGRPAGASAPVASASLRPADADPVDGVPPAREAPTRVQQQAERYVATLTKPNPEPVRVERADHFVTGEQMLSLVPQAAVEQITLAALRSDPKLTPDTPITVVREVEQVERVTPEQLIAYSGGDLDRVITVLDENDTARQTTVREVLDAARRAPDRPIDLVTTSEYFEQTTPRELAERAAAGAGEIVRIIRARHGLEAASLAQLMRAQSISDDSLFYVRTVRPEDSQGIWGIVHDGIIENFARGMAIRRGREVNTYRVEIPPDADERHEDLSSSFLGKLIHEKTEASYVYNFEHNRMGRNPDRIIPGQEIVIIDFQVEELIRIYRHFVEQRG